MGSVAYVLMEYPRLSETYITSELHRVEQAGVHVRLFVIKPEVEPHERGPHQPVLDKIRAQPQRLPGATSLDDASLPSWLRENIGSFRPAIRRTLHRRPLGLGRAALLALGQALRERKQWRSRPPKLYVKALLHAIALADGLLDHPDIRHIHAHYAHKPTTIAWLASSITALPFSFTAHARDIYDEERTPPAQLRRKLLAAEFVVTCTDANRRHLEQAASEASVHLIYHGLGEDTARLLETGPAVDGRNGHLRLLGVGRLVEKKGFDVLVEACGELARRGAPFEALIVGPDGDHADEVRGRISALGLADRVRLPGRMGQTELCGEYRRADAFCMPCRVLENNDRDGIPNVLVEAMASGVPVVSTPVSGIPELVVDGHNGLLVRPEDHDALADALLRIRDDRELADRLGRRAQATVRERFDGHRSAEQLAALFREVGV